MSIMKDILPEEEKWPRSFYETKKELSKLGLAYEKIDACINKCMLYYKENKHKEECVVCHHPRYKPVKPGARKKVPHSVLHYLPITPRLQRLYMSSHSCEHMTWHKKCFEDGIMTHPAHGEAWKHFDNTHTQFSSDPRSIRLGLCTDGFSPFNMSGAPYSCWPVILTVYNLPPGMCMQRQYMYLSMVIPGPKSPGKNLDVFLRPLIDELKMLWEAGIQTYDVCKKENFQMRAALLWTISDFPANAMVSGWSTHGLMACPYCMELTKSFSLRNGRKPSWFDCHRQFLPMDHPFRNQSRQFYNNRIEIDRPPPRLSGEQMRQRVEKLPNITFGTQSGKQKIDGFNRTHNWVKKSIFWELPYWHTNLIRHNLDVMHIEKNVFDNIFNTVMDVKDKSKDNANARADLELYCSRPNLHLVYDSNGKPRKPKALYTLTKEQKKEVCGWVKNLKLPDGKFDAAMMKDNPSINHIELGSLRDTNFVGWFNKYAEDPSNAVDDRIVRLSYLPCRVAKRYKGYFVNGFKFHTKEYGNSKSTMNSGVWVWGTSNENDMTDYYGMLEEIIELEYFGNENKVVLFKCHWYDTTSNNGIRVHPRLKLVEINQKSKLNTSDKFILAQQAQQVYYTDFPKHPIRHSRSRVRGEWRAVCKIKARSRIDVPHLEEHDDNDQLIHEGPFQEMEGSISEPRTNMNFVEEDHDPLNPDFDLQEVDPKDLARPQAHLFDIAEEEEGEEEEDDEEGAFENLFSNDEENLHENEDNEISDCDDEIDYDD
ncbi:hypothetical protein BUALT_Bualt05G0118600 [Buddleja alternifolia]|uniref:DUF4216 domain-containing protein n=1 Tax=Buddleja alternifolia TaxID=168488 RepID=A0AAV6XUA4_9LAMI|nr:hypothetical protein BUALT_Bualt05G0118600 [Buddleja alternifolia]